MSQRNPANIVIAFFAIAACRDVGRSAEPHLTIDARANPSLEVRVDSFSVPAASRPDFEAALHENAAFLEKLPGFEGHTVLEKTSGPTTFNIVTIAAWQSPEAMNNAGEKVREHDRAIGFDMQGSIARWGVTASIGSYHVLPALR
jgi:heme-degrading monooxygenase HmoA